MLTDPRLPVVYENGAAYVHTGCPYDLDATLGGGQAFRWKPIGPGAWEGAAGGHFARISETEGGIVISPCDEALFEGFWRHYLDLDGDYSAWARTLADDPVLGPIAGRCEGVRLLNQPVWECLVSFLLSSNNNVKRISGIVERLCQRYGEDMGGYSAFPAPARLLAAGEPGIFGCGAGYRAEYVYRAAKAVEEGFGIERLPLLGYEAAKRELMGMRGVGEKVADCVLLYSCGYREAFPVDVWVLRAMSVHFCDAGRTPKEMRKFAGERFGALAGLAQQYLFHFERVLNNH